MHLVLAWLVATGVVGFALMAADKARARAGRRRIRERTLLACAFVGGWAGMVVAMLVVRHKTRKAAFLAPFLACAILNAALLWWMASRLP